jgi:hypothetical protein
VALEGAAVELVEGTDGLAVTLWWRAREPLATSYTVFVHLIDVDGGLVASGDDLPRGGALPTERWQSGDRIVDKHSVALPVALGPGAYSVSVGLYDDTGRLPAWNEDGGRIANDAAHVLDWTNGGA